jgi:hypothetical protein
MLLWDMVGERLLSVGVSQLFADIHSWEPMRPVRHGQPAYTGTRSGIDEVADVDRLVPRFRLGLVLAGFDHVNHLRSGT